MFFINPYNELLSIMSDRRDTPSFFIGIVKNGLPNLTIQTGDIVLDRSNLMIDKGILLSNAASVSCSTGSITHNLKDTLKAGDSVVMLRSGDTFIIVSKVVSL